MAGRSKLMIIGVDEAGRGPLAGPVVAGAVILCPDGILGLNDSKKLSTKRRATLEIEIKARCRWAIGMANVEEIDQLNILQATMLAMTRAVEGLLNELRHPELVSGSMDQLLPHATQLAASDRPWMLKPVQHDESQLLILVDGNRLPKWPYPARAIIGGDALEPCISAASIIAKEHRDRMMLVAARVHPHYGWEHNMGYGTAQHLAALETHGPTPLHRRSFAPVAKAALLHTGE